MADQEHKRHYLTTEEVRGMSSNRLMYFLCRGLEGGYYVLVKQEEDPDYRIDEEDLKVQTHNMLKIYEELEVRGFLNEGSTDLFDLFFS